jgi:hypothetical protein
VTRSALPDAALPLVLRLDLHRPSAPGTSAPNAAHAVVDVAYAAA